jgi:uncharacterized damage-inducible protein DinB
LDDSLKETNENYESISSILNHIAKLNEEISDAGNETSNARKQQYSEELELAKEILAVRSTTEDSSFNFMSNKIPSGQNNPLNYWNNWAKGWMTLTEAFNKPETYIKDGKKVKSGLINY